MTWSYTEYLKNPMGRGAVRTDKFSIVVGCKNPEPVASLNMTLSVTILSLWRKSSTGARNRFGKTYSVVWFQRISVHHCGEMAGVPEARVMKQRAQGQCQEQHNSPRSISGDFYQPHSSSHPTDSHSLSGQGQQPRATAKGRSQGQEPRAGALLTSFLLSVLSCLL